MRQLLVSITILISLTLNTGFVYSSTGGVTSGGGIISGAKGDAGSREWIELRASGDLLAGRPKNRDIELITIYAPGIDKSHLILREMKLPGGRRSLILSAPDKLARKTLRSTIYLKHDSLNIVLLENISGRWIERKPQAIWMTEEVRSGNPRDVLLAFTVEKFGSYRVQEGKSQSLGETYSTSKDQSASSLFGGGYTSGVMPWVGAFLLLGMGWTLSRWIHGIERSREK